MASNTANGPQLTVSLDPNLAARLETLRATHRDIEASIQNRNHLLSVRDQSSSMSLQHADNRSWKTQADNDTAMYHAVVRQMEIIGDRVTPGWLELWEMKAEALRKRTLNRSEIVDENGWWDAPRWQEKPGVFKEGWSFQNA